jgi:hypothetical protein
MNPKNIDLTDSRLLHVIENPVRLACLSLLRTHRHLTAQQALKALKIKALKKHRDLTLGQVVYHVGVLERCGVIERAIGSTVASFRPTDTGELLILMIDTAPEGGST